jgi:hypothetical protein
LLFAAIDLLLSAVHRGRFDADAVELGADARRPGVDANSAHSVRIALPQKEAGREARPAAESNVAAVALALVLSGADTFKQRGQDNALVAPIATYAVVDRAARCCQSRRSARRRSNRLAPASWHALR